MSSPDMLDMPPPKAENKAKEVLVQTGIYASAGAVGLAAAANKISHNFYREAKNWPGLDKLREQRISDWSNLAKKRGQSFADYIKEHAAIEKRYTEAFAKELKASRGIDDGHSLRSLYQKWRASGPHTRQDALLSMASTTIITLGGLLALSHSKKLSNAMEQQEEQRSGGISR